MGDKEEQKKPKKIYQVTSSFADLNLKKFFAYSTSLYVAENTIYYPFDVVRTKLQVERVRLFLCDSQFDWIMVETFAITFIAKIVTVQRIC